jgi:hypothetical protein
MAPSVHAELVRCTSKDGSSSVIRRDKCDREDDVRTPVTVKSPLPPGGAPPAGKPQDEALAAYQAKDYARARELFSERAERGDPLAMLLLGDIYKNGRGVRKDEAAAYSWSKRAADTGDPRGQAAQAALLQDGIGTPRNDAAAFALLQKSANQGYPLAQGALGSAYLHGRGTAKNEELAAVWLRKAADQGVPEAAEMLKRIRR